MSFPETRVVVLVVDDEDPVRRTIQDWLLEANLGVDVLTAQDPESALLHAHQQTIDLAILDWNLGAGVNGLELLQDLYEFNPNIIAIMITAYADQATPLDAMRRGVRDYLDKNQELTRHSFLSAVERQLNYIRPAKRERRLHQELVSFRSSVEKILPLVDSLSALSDPVTLPEVIGSFFRFVMTLTGARDGVLYSRHYDPDKPDPETCRVYDLHGDLLQIPLVPFPQSIAGTVISMQETCLMNNLPDHEKSQSIELQPYEVGKFSLLAVPLAVAPGIHVVIELFDKQKNGERDPEGFTQRDLLVLRDSSQFGVEILRQTLSQRRTHRLLLDALGAALKASEGVTRSIMVQPVSKNTPTEEVILEQLQEGLERSGESENQAQETIRLAEAIRILNLRHGNLAIRHCTEMVEKITDLLDEVTGYQA
ncbi:MAG: response regulator [Bdellovibrionales bacterium]